MEQLKGAGYEIPSLIHPTAYVSPSAQIQERTIILPKAVVHTNARIEQSAIIGIGALVDHDAIIRRFNHILPGGIVSAYKEVELFASQPGS